MGETGEAAQLQSDGRGRWAKLYRLIWWPLFFVVTAATLAGLYAFNVPYESQTRYLADYGLRWHWDGQVLGQPLGDESRAAGIEGGRTIVSIDGRRPAPGNPGEAVVELLKSAGDEIVVVTRGSAGDLRTHRLRRGPHHREQANARSPISFNTIWWIETSLDFLSGLLGIAAAFLLYRRHRHDMVAAILSLAFLLYSGDANAPHSTFFLFGAQEIPFAFKTVGSVCLLVGILLFPDGRFWPRWSRALAPFIVLWALFAIWFKIGDLGPAEEVVNSVGVLFALVAVGLLLGRYRTLPPSIGRQQIRWATFGFAVGIILAIIPTVGVMVMARTEDPAAYALVRILVGVTYPAAPLAMAAGLLVSVLRFRLYDVDLVISRSAGVAGLTLALGAIYAGASQALEAIFQSSFGDAAGLWAGAFGAALAVILFVPLNNLIQSWAERRFQKDVISLRRDLPDCVGDLRETASLSELLGEILERARTGTRATAAAVEMDGRIAARVGEESQLPVRIPLKILHRDEEVGGLLISARPDGTLPGKDEREALEEVADPIARAIHIVARREAREEALEQRLATIESRLASAKDPHRADAAE